MASLAARDAAPRMASYLNLGYRRGIECPSSISWAVSRRRTGRTITATTTIIDISWDIRSRSSSRGVRQRPPGSMAKFESFGGRKMKNVASTTKKARRHVTLSSGTVEAFIGRSLARARRMDRGEKFPDAITMTFEDPSDLVRVLSAQRLRVLRAVRAKPAPISDLAAILGRDRKAVRRDVSLLQSFGLVLTREEVNPGHGRKRISEPRAAKYQLLATI